MKKYTLNNYTFDITEEIESLIEQGLIEVVVLEDDGEVPPQPFVEIRTNLEITPLDVTHFIDKFNNIIEANKHAEMIAEHLKIPCRTVPLNYNDFVLHTLNEWIHIFSDGNKGKLPLSIREVLNTSYVNYKSSITKKDKVFEGTVAWYSPLNGYGYINSDDGDEVFVHFSNIIMNGFKCLNDGDKVSFKKQYNFDKINATEVRKI